jgi:hypothetical protein
MKEATAVPIFKHNYFNELIAERPGKKGRSGNYYRFLWAGGFRRGDGRGAAIPAEGGIHRPLT